jgi:hypothetical protein
MKDMFVGFGLIIIIYCSATLYQKNNEVKSLKERLISVEKDLNSKQGVINLIDEITKKVNEKNLVHKLNWGTQTVLIIPGNFPVNEKKK